MSSTIVPWSTLRTDWRGLIKGGNAQIDNRLAGAIAPAGASTCCVRVEGVEIPSS
jgi:hypothetical protein